MKEGQTQYLGTVWVASSRSVGGESVALSLEPRAHGAPEQSKVLDRGRRQRLEVPGRFSVMVKSLSSVSVFSQPHGLLPEVRTWSELYP